MRTRIPALFALLLVLLAMVALSASKITDPQATYRFEPQPRAPLAAVGISASRDPKLVLRASGAVYLLAVHGSHAESRLGLSISHDGGDSFAPPVSVSLKGAAVSSHGENSPSLAAGKTTEFYALWEQKTGKGMNSDLMFARSLRFGHHFDPPVRVTDKETPSTNAFSSLAVAPNGDVYVAWLDGRDRKLNPPGTSSVYLAKSMDRGASFGKNIRVALGVCPCCRPTMAFGSAGEVYVSWRHVFPGQIRDMVVATSSDRGQTFGEPVRVAEDNWKINGCPHSGASMAQKGNRLYIAWYSDGDGTNSGLRVAWSDAGAKSFSKPVMASGEILDANHPDLSVADDGRILLVFQGRDPVADAGWSPAGPYLAEILASGQVTVPLAVPGHRKTISYPTVAGGTVGRVFLAWTETAEKGRQIMLSRGRRGQSSKLPAGRPSTE